jgi:site-specific recombinase XerD
MTDIIHGQKKSVKTAQKVAGHVTASTTLVYEELPEESLQEALKEVGNFYTVD